MTATPFQLGHPCNCPRSVRTNSWSLKMERDQCRARGQKNAYVTMAAELIDVLAMKALVGSRISRDEAMQARKVAQNLRDYL